MEIENWLTLLILGVKEYTLCLFKFKMRLVRNFVFIYVIDSYNTRIVVDCHPFFVLQEVIAILKEESLESLCQMSTKAIIKPSHFIFLKLKKYYNHVAHFPLHSLKTSIIPADDIIFRIFLGIFEF